MFDSPVGRPTIRRAIIVVLDGLRPDAIEKFQLANLTRLMDAGASARDAITVSPSITTAAIASLFTGVSPNIHGVKRDRFQLTAPDANAVSIATLLSQAGHPSSAFLAELPAIVRPLMGRVKRRLGLGALRSVGRTAEEILDHAKPTLHEQRRGLIFLHWPDADRAGHRFGWMSEPYAAAARRMDDTLGRLAHFCGLPHDDSTLLILLADHGGGGVKRKNHDEPHPDNERIFIALCGGGAQPTKLEQVTLLDIAPTVLWALGLTPPPMFEGRVLDEPFAQTIDPLMAEPVVEAIVA